MTAVSGVPTMPHISRLASLRRREFLKRASALSVAGTAAP